MTISRLAAGEQAELELVFIVDPDLPASVNSVTLSYTTVSILPISVSSRSHSYSNFHSASGKATRRVTDVNRKQLLRTRTEQAADYHCGTVMGLMAYGAATWVVVADNMIFLVGLDHGSCYVQVVEH